MIQTESQMGEVTTYNDPVGPSWKPPWPLDTLDEDCPRQGRWLVRMVWCGMAEQLTAPEGDGTVPTGSRLLHFTVPCKLGSTSCGAAHGRRKTFGSSLRPRVHQLALGPLGTIWERTPSALSDALRKRGVSTGGHNPASTAA